MKLEKPNPMGKRVSLFVTCIVDMIYPQTGLSVLKIFDYLGIAYDFPMEQTCCGQPAFNSGYRTEARTVARQFLKAFAESEVIVTPSGSCAAMIRHEYPALFTENAEEQALAENLASNTWELTEFIVEGLGIEDLHLKLPTSESFAFHDACHGMRLLGLGQASRILVNNLENAEVLPMAEADVCCGFGGLFSVKMPAVSDAMLQNKVRHIEATEAKHIITGDVSCLTQMNGGLSRRKSKKRVKHIADVLAEGIVEGKHYES
jgi:L-lactate dehydrogenase complex protein LldE